MNVIKLFIELIKKLDGKKSNNATPKQDHQHTHQKLDNNHITVLTPGYPPQRKEIVTESSKNPNLMEVNLRVVGLKYDNEDGTNRQEILKCCTVGDSIELKREPIQKYPNAIKVLFDGECIGYISEDDNKRLAKYMDRGGQIFDAQISYLYLNSKNVVSTCEIIFWRNKMR